MHKIDPALMKAAIGYIINKKYWNQGLTTEANRAVIKLVFEKIGMNKLVALHDKDNPASGKVMEKSGMRFSHAEPYACMDQHEEGRIVTRVHYYLPGRKGTGRPENSHGTGGRSIGENLSLIHISQYVLPPLLALFNRHYPEIRIRLKSGNKIGRAHV